jgi:hypothetical protein
VVSVAEIKYVKVVWLQTPTRLSSRTASAHIAVVGAPETLCDRMIAERVEVGDDIPICSMCKISFKSELEWSAK